MKKKRCLAWITICSICLLTFIAPYSAIIANAMTTIETDVATASAGCTILGVYGSYYSEAQALESIARIRAAEGGLAYSFLSSGYDRLNGKGTFSISYNGISSFAENLAYNSGTSMVYGINQWYSEKTDWVEQDTTAVTGHYTSMINPRNTYVGLGDFYTNASTYPNTLAGEFSSSSQTLNQTMQAASSDVMQKIEVKTSYITGYTLDGVTSIYTDKTTTLTPKANLVNGSKVRGHSD